jgi:hypothetical protein
VQIRKQWRDKEIFSKGQSPKMIKECWTKVLMVESKENDLRIIFGWKIDNNKNNEK